MKRAEIIELLEPFRHTKIYNPNRSTSALTVRTLSMRALDIARLKFLYDRLVQEEENEK